MKFSSLFENKSTLDNLNRPQLVALCKLIGISSIGPDYYLRFTLHLKLRHLEADDKLIEFEGIENLNVEELQAACRERGMRAYGVSIERLHSQLQQWLDLHLNKRIPTTILLLSRALYLPENISQENILKAAIQSLPKSVDNLTAVKLAQVSGERVDNTQRIEYIKHEDEAIRQEQEDKAKKKKLTEQIIIPTTPLDVSKAEILVDKASILVDMRKQEKKDEQHIDVGQFETALGQLVNRKAKEVRSTVEEIRDLKVNLQIEINFLIYIYFSRRMLKNIKKMLKNLKQ
jgi:LETM1 and EF-hand domain-containing protein 1